jgi:hypothetical protein
MEVTAMGIFGVFTVMKTQSDVPLASFPVDEETSKLLLVENIIYRLHAFLTVTFGRDPSCDVRLYYPSVSAVHAKIVSKPGISVLVLLGINGGIVNGQDMYPSERADGNIIPVETALVHGMEFEIHGKRFRWSYPPKGTRPPVTVNTPTKQSQRAMPPSAVKKKLRLSMIHSAQVFSPRPSKNPLENLKILQTPLKPAFVSPLRGSPRASNRRASSPLKHKTLSGAHPVCRLFCSVHFASYLCHTCVGIGL